MEPTAPESSAADAHATALVCAYALVEAAQDREVTTEIDVLDACARDQDWADVRCVLHFARSLAARDIGVDDTEHLRAMLSCAATAGDQGLVALAHATSALRRADARQELTPDGSGISPLVRAVGLLDGATGLAVHRAAAHIDVASTFHALGLWELAIEHYDLAEAALDAEGGGIWTDVAHRQRRAVTVNRIDVVMDWACALAEVDAWDAAAALARGARASAMSSVDHEWPSTWVADLYASGGVLAALAGEHAVPDPPRTAVRPGDLRTQSNLALSVLADAVRAARAGQWSRAASLAAACSDRFAPSTPPHARLLAMSLAAHRADEAGPALMYARELARLRWNTRVDRLGSMRASIDIEHKWLEHEQLRRQALVDDLTGLANRRAYNAFLDALHRGTIEGGEQQPHPPSGDIAVMMLDVDLFKGINDTFGHDVGDQVLRRIGAVLAAQVRVTDLAARLGGDEFVVVLTDAPAGLPEARAQQIIDAVRDHAWDELAPGLRVSVSLGLRRGDRGNLAELLSDADRHLYRAKRGGRGRVTSVDAPADRQPTVAQQMR
ncbi:GGDEF domain-containing protein [Cryptosporangium sp. NPDC051539]|uniref:GGDEF domain-containing protein n=1 Tax=Cryptosporangium sp. NPDC051539 TaxID=3363962 RepID=UPI00379952BE